MPEFRFRRKKQGSRRRTVKDADETAKQLQAATQLVNELDKHRQPEAISGREDEGPEKRRMHREKDTLRLMKTNHLDRASGGMELGYRNGGPPNMVRVVIT